MGLRKETARSTYTEAVEYNQQRRQGKGGGVVTEGILKGFKLRCESRKSSCVRKNVLEKGSSRQTVFATERTFDQKFLY